MIVICNPADVQLNYKETVFTDITIAAKKKKIGLFISMPSNIKEGSKKKETVKKRSNDEQIKSKC